MPTAIIKDFITDNGLEVEGSITLGDQTVTNLVDSSAINAIVTSPSVASTIVATGGATTKTYDSADLLPASDNTAGEMAYVNANNRLYLWNGVGWYGIALINVSPTFDSGGSPNSSYTLDSNGGATTTITLNATDPEGATIQYSYLSDSASKFVTISQSNNVFTLTTLSNSALDDNGNTFGGTFNITFRATDGVNIAPAVSNFSLTIIVNYDWSTSSQQGERFITEGSSVSAYFGDDVGISRNGNTIIVGAKYERLRANGQNGGTAIKGTANIFTRSPTAVFGSIANTTYSNVQSPLLYSSMGSGVSPELTGFVFNANGTKIITIGKTHDKLDQWSCSTAYDITSSSLSHDSVQFSVGSQATHAECVRANNDGTKLYVVCSATDKIYEYDLSTAYDISTASYNNVNFAVTQDNNPRGIFFKPDGLTMYLAAGSTHDKIWQYSLSSAWDLSTISYANKASPTVYPQTSSWPQDVVFFNDGAKMVIIGQSNDALYQYNLTTAWDVSTASYASAYFSVSSQDTTPSGLTLHPADSTKLFLAGNINGRIVQYNLDASLWSHEQRLVSSNYSSTTDQFGYAVAISGDGTLAAIGAPYATTTISSQSRQSGRIEIWKKRNGTWQFGCEINPSVDQYNTGENDHRYGYSVDVDAVGDRIIVGAPYKDWTQSPSLSNCGAVYVYKNNGNTSHDLVNGSLEGSYTVTSQDGNPMALAFNNDGTKFYMAGQTTDAIYQYSLSTAYDVTTATYDNVSLDISTQVPYVTAINWNNDGTKLWASTPNSYGGASSSLFEYAFTTPYDLSTGSYNNYDIDFTSDVTLSSNESRPWGLTFKPDGTKMFMTGWQGYVFAFNLSTAWDISSFSYTYETSSSFTSQDSNMQGIAFNNDGTKCYLVGRSNKKIYQYSLSTAWNVATMAYDNINLDVSVEGTPSQMAFNPTGTKLYVTGYTNNDIQQFTVQGLGVSEEAVVYADDASSDDMYLGWDVVITPDGNRIIAGAENYGSNPARTGRINVFDRSGTTWSQHSKIMAGDAAQDDEFGASVDVTSDGNTIVVGAPREDTGATDAGAAYIYEYGGKAYYDIPSMAYNNKYFTVSSQENQPTGFDFNADGTKMFVVGRQYHRVFAYSLSTAYDVSTATYDGINFSKFIGTVIASAEGMKFSPDGTKCYFIGDGSSTQDRLWQYNLSVPYNILTMAYSNNYIQVSSQNSNPTGFTFKPDGTKFFAIGYSGNDHVYAYDLTTAWDLSTASYNNVSFQVSGQNSDMKDIKFNADGTKMFATGTGANGRMYQYNLSTAWDISSASYNSVYYYFGTHGEYYPHQVDFNPDGSKLWMIGQTNDRIYEFETNTQNWTETKFMASNAAASSDYGRSVAIDEQGQIAMVGANKHASSIGEVYVYKRTGTSWSSSTEQKKLISLTSDTSSGTPQFGDAIALSRGGGTAVVGAPSVLAGGAGSAGGIYIFTGTRTYT